MRIKENKLLLTAFRGTSAELLVKDMKSYETLLLPNDKVKDSELLIEKVQQAEYDYIIAFGQRPNIKDKVHVETTARDGETRMNTDFDYERLQQALLQNDIPAKLSHNAGTSFCNRLYWNGLRYLSEQQEDRKAKMVFVHVPFAKNISDFEWFKKRIMQAITSFIQDETEKCRRCTN